MKSLSRNEYIDVERLLAAPKAIYEKAFMKVESGRDAYFVFCAFDRQSILVQLSRLCIMHNISKEIYASCQYVHEMHCLGIIMILTLMIPKIEIKCMVRMVVI